MTDQTSQTGNPEAGTGKPEITKLQADWHVHVAAIHAQTAAAKSGCDPESATALLDAGAGGLTIAGVTFPPLGASLVLALPLFGKLISKSELLQQDGCEMAAMALGLYDTPAFWRLLRAGDITKLEEAVFDFMGRFTLGDLSRITAWINSEYKRLRGDAEEQQVEKKSPVAERVSAPTPPSSTNLQPPTAAAAEEMAGS